MYGRKTSSWQCVPYLIGATLICCCAGVLSPWHVSGANSGLRSTICEPLGMVFIVLFRCDCGSSAVRGYACSLRASFIYTNLTGFRGTDVAHGISPSDQLVTLWKRKTTFDCLDRTRLLCSQHYLTGEGLSGKVAIFLRKN